MATATTAPPNTSEDQASRQARVVEAAKSFIPRLRASQAETDQEARTPQDLADELRAAGLYSLAIPKVYGGVQANVSTWMQVLSELGKGNGGVSWAATLINVCNWVAATVYPRHVVDEIFDDPKSLCAGVFAHREIKARPASGGIFIERGIWMWNSGVNLAKWDLLGVPLFNDAGEQVSRGIAAIPIEDVNILWDWNPIGLRGSGSSNVTVENVFVPHERIAESPRLFRGEYEGGFRDIPVYNSAFMPVNAIVLAFPVLGLGEHMIEELLKKMPTRNIPYTPYFKSGEAPVTHLQLGEASGKIEAAKALAEKCCQEIDTWAGSGEMMPFMDRARHRLYTGAVDRLIWEGVDILASAGAGSFARHGNLLNRIWEDVRVGNMHGIAAPTSNYELWGRLLCGMDANMMMV